MKFEQNETNFPFIRYDKEAFEYEYVTKEAIWYIRLAVQIIQYFLVICQIGDLMDSFIVILTLLILKILFIFKIYNFIFNL